MKVLISVLGCKHHYFRGVEQAQKDTFLKELPPDFDYLFYYGSDAATFSLSGKELFCPATEQTNVLHKTLESFRYVLDHYEFDFLYRICNSSYIAVGNFARYIEKFDSSGLVYNGVIGKFNSGGFNTSFVSGAGMLMSRGTVAAIAKKYTENGIRGLIQRYPYQDDVVIGCMCSELEILMTQAPRIDLRAGCLCEDANFRACDKNLHHHYHPKQRADLIYSLHEFFKTDTTEHSAKI